ncbi:MAG TPA: diguanylate cyclase [Solirubrobacterales bacterium]|jgi:diguanylate cyclase (GGDEF)-like protein
MSEAPFPDRLASEGRILLGRLAWGQIAPVTVFEDRGTMARTYTYLFGIGGTLLSATFLLPHSPDRNLWVLGGVAVAAYAVALTFLVRFDRLPLWTYRVAPLVGTVMIGLIAYFAGASAVPAYAFFLFWVVLAGSYFFDRVIAAGHALAACGVYAVVILARDVPLAALNWVMASGTILVAAAVMSALREQVALLLDELAAVARSDSLTGLANRRVLEERFAAELERSARTGRALSILLLDLDWFKEFNDRFGHSAGDRALTRLAAALRRGTRNGELAARLGGEEFAVLAPEANEGEGLLLAERLRDEVKAAFAREPAPLTISCGVATFPAHGITSGELLHAADRARYEAKEAGRNRSVVFSHAHEPGAEPERVGVERASPSLASLMSLAEAVDRRKGSPANSRRVGRYAERLARELNLPEEHVERVRVAALLRDVGEVGVAESILGKAGPLTDDEREELERHPEIGARIVGAAHVGHVDEWILTHHERPDGGGYPRGLSGHQIPLEGKIVAVADAYAAMTAARPYRRPFSSKRALAELQARAGSQFDHEVVEAFLSLQGELEADAEPADEASARAGS